MIGRVFRGASPYGLVRYLYGAGRRNEHTDPHLVASWDGDPAAIEPQVIDTGAGTSRHDVAGLVDLLEQPVKVCPAATKQWVYHLVLRNDPGDRRLSDDEWREVCETAMDRTGIAPAGDPAGCRWVAVRHAEDHIHLVATLAREDGRAPRVWNDFAQLRGVAHEFEARYGLRSTAACDDQTAARRPGVKEQVTADAAGRKIAPRVALRRAVKAAAGRSHSFDEFSSLLAADGVTVWPRMSQRDPSLMTGYSVSLNDWTNSAGEPVRFGGGKLAPDLSLPKLRGRWDPAIPSAPGGGPSAAREGQQTPAAAGEPAALPRLDDAEREHVWREAERIVREAAERIGVDTTTDPAAAADAAWAASDTLAAAAEALGADDGDPLGGALTRAADELDRAGREQHRRLPARTETGAALRTASRMITVLAAGTRNEGAQVAAVMVALASLAAAVADLRRTQQRAVQAAAADRAVVDLRAHAQQLQTTAAAAAAAPTPRTRPQRAQTAADVASLFGPTAGASPPPRRRTAAPKPDTIEEELRRAQHRDDGRGRGR